MEHVCFYLLSGAIPSGQFHLYVFFIKQRANCVASQNHMEATSTLSFVSLKLSLSSVFFMINLFCRITS